MKLKDILGIGCYISFETSKEMRQWIVKSGLYFDYSIAKKHTHLRVSCGMLVYSTATPVDYIPVHHHSTIEL